MASSLMTSLRRVLPAIVCLGALAATPVRAEVGYLDETWLVGWGLNDYGQADVPTGWDFTQVAGGDRHSLALKSDGTLAAWGNNDYGQTNVPPGNDFTQVAGGGYHSLALKSDGTLDAWGLNDYGQADVPAGWDFTQVAAGGYHSLALKSDGSLAAWGGNWVGQTNVPAGNDFTQVAGGFYHSLALKSDGSLAAWGDNWYGQTNVPAGNDFTQVAGGNDHSLALKSGGTLAAWGRNDYGQTNVPAGNDFTQVVAGGFHGLALKSDGSLAAWGWNGHGQTDVPDGYFLTIAAGLAHNLAIQARPSYDDLLVSGSDQVLQRPIDVAGDATVESMMEMVNNPTMTVAGRATIRGSGGIRGAGTIAGDVRAEYGSRIIATGDLTLGDAAQFGALLLDGELYVGADTLTLNDKTTTQLGRLTVVEGGTLAAPNGLLVAPGTSLAGMGTIDGRLINQGLVAAGEPGEDLQFNDPVSGAGSFTGSMIFNGGFSPGNSPVTQHFDWVTLTESNTLTMELGGVLYDGQFDQLIVNHSATLGGTLSLAALSNLQPDGQDWGDESYPIITGAAVDGEFSDGPPVYGHLGHGVFHQGVTYNANSVVVDVFQAVAGDTDGDRDVEIGDIMDILAAGKFGDGPVGAVWPQGNFDGDLDCDISDIMLILAAGKFDTGPYAKGTLDSGSAGQAELVVTADGLVIDTAGATINGYVLTSESGIFSGEAADNLGLFSEDSDEVIAGQFAFTLTGTHLLGDVIGDGFDAVDLPDDLTLTYTLTGQGGIYTATIAVPEPTTLMLLAGAVAAMLATGVRRRQPCKSLIDTARR